MSDMTTAVRQLNDRFRQGDLDVPGRLLITRGLIDLLEEERSKLTALKSIKKNVA